MHIYLKLMFLWLVLSINLLNTNRNTVLNLLDLKGNLLFFQQMIACSNISLEIIMIKKFLNILWIPFFKIAHYLKHYVTRSPLNWWKSRLMKSHWCQMPHLKFLRIFLHGVTGWIKIFSWNAGNFYS